MEIIFSESRNLSRGQFFPFFDTLKRAGLPNSGRKREASRKTDANVA